MRAFGLLAASVAAFALNAPASAAPVLVTFAGDFTGTLDNAPFAAFGTLRGISDTNDLIVYGSETFAPLSSLSLQTNGMTYAISTPTIFFLGLLTPNSGGAALVFDLANGQGNNLGGNFAFSGPDFSGPVSLPYAEYRATLDTSGGVATITGGSNLTFSYGISAVPEPATWALMIVGFGLVGASMRRRSATVASHSPALQPLAA